jgi:hypothetical protein
MTAANDFDDRHLRPIHPQEFGWLTRRNPCLRWLVSGVAAQAETFHFERRGFVMQPFGSSGAREYAGSAHMWLASRLHYRKQGQGRLPAVRGDPDPGRVMVRNGTRNK